MEKNSRIDWAQFIVISLLAPFFLFPSVKYIWILFVPPLIWIIRGLMKKNFVERSVLDWAIFLLLAQVLMSSLCLSGFSISLPKIAGVLLGIFTFYSITAVLKQEKAIKAGAIVFLTGGFIFVLLSIPGMIRYGAEWKFFDKIYKVLALVPKIKFNLTGAEAGFHPNAVGGALLLFSPAFIFLGFYSIRKKSRKNFFVTKSGRWNNFFWIFIWAGIGIFAIAILMVRSRGSWIGLVLSLALFLSILSRKKAVGLVIIIFFVVFYLGILVSGKMFLAAAEIGEKFTYRMDLWEIAVEKISEKPLFGIGMDQFRLLPGVRYVDSHSHNHFLHTAAELGIPALVAYLAILIGTGYMCQKIWMKGKIKWMRWFVLGLGCGQLAHFIFGLGDSIPIGGKPGIIFWVSLALIASIYNYAFSQNLCDI